MKEKNLQPKTVLEFWFGGPDPQAADLEERIDFWFAAGPEDDAMIQQRFDAAVGDALSGQLNPWRDSPRGRLALIILLDQLTRCLYRGTPDAFVGDAAASALSAGAMDSGMDGKLGILERAFLYMPLQHAEDIDLQARSVAAFESLLKETLGDGLRTQMKRFFASAKTHRGIIERFGRFPHRNHTLDRECTPQEIEFLRLPAAPFRGKS